MSFDPHLDTVIAEQMFDDFRKRLTAFYNKISNEEPLFVVQNVAVIEFFDDAKNIEVLTADSFVSDDQIKQKLRNAMLERDRNAKVVAAPSNTVEIELPGQRSGKKTMTVPADQACTL